MTLPNRRGYVPGQHRQERKRPPVTAASSGKMLPLHHKKPSQFAQQQIASFAEMKQELQDMLLSLSPTDIPGRMVVSSSSKVPQSKEEAKTQVERTRKQLHGDSTFQQNESYRRLVSITNNPILRTSTTIVDPLDTAIELLPRSKLFPADGDGSQRLNELARTVNEQVDDPTVRSRYDQAASLMEEYEARRVNHQRAGEGSGLSSPTSTFSVAFSPFADSTPRKRSSLSKTAKTLMNRWFQDNLHHPYPTEEEKQRLATEGGITLEQVNNWFINTRGRKWKPMLTRLMAEKQAGDCELYDMMVKKIEQPYRRA